MSNDILAIPITVNANGVDEALKSASSNLSSVDSAAKSASSAIEELSQQFDILQTLTMAANDGLETFAQSCDLAVNFTDSLGKQFDKTFSSSGKNAVNFLESLKNKLGETSDESSGVDAALKDTSLNLANIDSAASDSSLSIANLSQQFGLLQAAAIGSVAGFAAFIHSCAQAGDSAENLQRQFDRTFSDAGESANESLESLKTELDRTTGSVQDLMVSSARALANFDITGEKSVELSSRYARLTEAIANYQDVSTDQAGGAIEQALLGQTRGLKQLGITLTENEIKYETFAQKMEGMTFASEEAAKASATLSLIERRAGDALGELGNKSERYSEQMKVFWDQLGDAAESAGSALIPALNAILKEVNELIKGFNALDEPSKSLITWTVTLAGGVTTATIAFKAMSPILKTVAAMFAFVTAAKAADTKATIANTDAVNANTVAKSANAKAGFGATGGALLAAGYGIYSAGDSIVSGLTGKELGSANIAGKIGKGAGELIGNWWGNDPDIERRSKDLQEKMKKYDDEHSKQLEAERLAKAKEHERQMQVLEDSKKLMENIDKEWKAAERKNQESKMSSDDLFNTATRKREDAFINISNIRERMQRGVASEADLRSLEENKFEYDYNKKITDDTSDRYKSLNSSLDSSIKSMEELAMSSDERRSAMEQEYEASKKKASQEKDSALAMEELLKSFELANELANMQQAAMPKDPLVAETASSALIAGSVEARRMESRIWNTAGDPAVQAAKSSAETLKKQLTELKEIRQNLNRNAPAKLQVVK